MSAWPPDRWWSRVATTSAAPSTSPPAWPPAPRPARCWPRLRWPRPPPPTGSPGPSWASSSSRGSPSRSGSWRPARPEQGSGTDPPEVRVGVDRGAAARVDLEVDVGGGVAGVAGLAVVGDQLAGPDPGAGTDGVPRQVGVEVLDAVVALQVQLDAAVGAGRLAADHAVDDGEDPRPVGGHHVGALVAAAAGAGRAPAVDVRVGALQDAGRARGAPASGRG